LADVVRGREDLIDVLWRSLQTIPMDTLIGEGRVYGGGLYKLEPKELANASADSMVDALVRTRAVQEQLDLFG